MQEEPKAGPLNRKAGAGTGLLRRAILVLGTIYLFSGAAVLLLWLALRAMAG